MQSFSPDIPLEALRAEIRAIQASPSSGTRARLPFGVHAMDSRIGGGLVPAGLHEIISESSALSDDAAATLFVAGIAARLGGSSGAVLWALTRRDLFAPSLAQAGLCPNRMIYAECRNDDEALPVMEEGLRHGGLAVVVGEIGRATMTAMRRLQLAAEDSGVTALLLRRWRRGSEDPLASPSAAVTRWRIGCVPSELLPVSGIGRPRWKVELVRQRGGPSYEWILEGTDEAGRLALPVEPSHRPAAPDRGAAQVRSAA